MTDSNSFNMCPLWGSKKIENPGMRKWICRDCGFDLYNNVASAVGIIIHDKFDYVLFEVRAKEPRKGFLALPGGFVDFDESAEQAVVRECKEEIGVDIEAESVKFLCTNPNTYPYKGITYKTCDIFFTAELPSQYKDIADFIGHLKAQESEVTAFVSKKLASVADLEELPLAFESAVKTLHQFLGLSKDKRRI